MNKKAYLELGIALCNTLVKLVPIIPFKDSYEGRKNAEKIEKDWIKRLPRSFNYNNKQVKIITPNEDDRSWVDLIFIYDESFFPINFKAGLGETADNISGLKYLGYLLFNGVREDYSVPGISSHKALAKRIIEIKKGVEELNLENRDYFCIAYNLENEIIKVIPISCMNEEDLIVNPSNVFQANFHTASFDINRTQKDSIDFIINKYIEYAKKKADAYILFKEAGLIE